MAEKISCIIPCYNEEKYIMDTLVSVIRYCETHFDDFEILCVDDCSTDMTAYSIALFQHNYPNRIKLIRNVKNWGKGYSVREGMKVSKYPLVLVMDADSSASIKELPKLLKYIAHGYNMVAGSRYSEDSIITTPQSIIRRFYSRAFNGLVQSMFGLGIKDTQAGFKLYDRSAVALIINDSVIDRFAFDVEHFVIIKRNTMWYRETGIQWGDKKPNKVKFKQIKEMFRDIMRIRNNDNLGMYG